MYLHNTSQDFIIGPKFKYSDFPILMKKHIKKFPGVPALETEAQELILSNFTFPAAEQYIRNVCRWGNFAGVGGRVIKNNTINEVQDAFRDAYAFLNANTPSPSAALARLNMISGLGTPSFASKHLRFLKPEICPVYDAILTDKLPYTFDPDGYAEFSSDCQTMAEKLNNESIENPGRKTKQWLAADVEAAMFSKFYR